MHAYTHTFKNYIEDLTLILAAVGSGQWNYFRVFAFWIISINYFFWNIYVLLKECKKFLI